MAIRRRHYMDIVTRIEILKDATCTDNFTCTITWDDGSQITKHLGKQDDPLLFRSSLISAESLTVYGNDPK